MDLKEVKRRILSDPEVRAHYEEVRPVYQVIGEIIRMRQRRHITQAELAERLGTTQSVVARIESGRGNVTLGTLERIAEAMECSLSISLKPKKDDEEDQDTPHLVACEA